MAVLLLLLSTTGCDESPTLTGPSAVPQAGTPPVPPSPVAVSVQDVTLGERVEGVSGDGKTISPGEHHFFLTVPRDGTLTVTLTWDPWFVGTLLKLTLEGRSFLPPNWSPIVGRLPVDAAGCRVESDSNRETDQSVGLERYGMDLGLQLKEALRAEGVAVFMCRVERYADMLFATLVLKGFATELQSDPGLDDAAAIRDLVEKAKRI